MKLPCLGKVQEDLRVPFCRREPQEPEAKTPCFLGLPSSGALGTSLARSSRPIMEMIYSGELTGSASEVLSFCDLMVASKCCRFTCVLFFESPGSN